jgi:hypothetical protein
MVDEPDTNQVEKRLSEILYKERREAIGYAVLTVLCTPVFAAMVGLVAWIAVGFVLIRSEYDIDVKAFYTGLNIFLALMIVFVLKYTNPPEQPHDFDKNWLVAVVIFILLLIFTYATKYPEKFPAGFGIIYAGAGLFILGLLGKVFAEGPYIEYDNRESQFFSLILALMSFVAMSYGELLSSSWLWIPPKQDEVRICAWILCKLALEEKIPIHHSGSVDKHLLHIMSRLKLVQVKGNMLKLTLKGRDLVFEEMKD